MCGIVGYIGNRKVVPIILDGLKRLEYRGYDSAGIAYLQAGEIVKHRCKGKLANLEEMLADHLDVGSTIGVGHTRWATHGAPSEINAHPHGDCSGKIVVVHNGIIENYHTLREMLKMKGHVFTSETDTEVLAHLIEEHYSGGGESSFVAAVKEALKQVEGSYAMGVLCSSTPNMLVAARNQSPLVMGIHESGACFIASDIPALLPYTRNVVFLEDEEVVILKRDGWQVSTLHNDSLVSKNVETINWNANMAEKAGYKHFMLKEIFEQPQAILNTFPGRLDPETGEVRLPEIGLTGDDIRSLERVSLVACGTSWHAALVGKYWLEKWAAIPVEVDIASEFRYRTLILNEKTLVIPISQSGETADTLAGLRRAKGLGAKVAAICNVVGSTITREAHGTIYTHAGPEIGVASTKAFTSQLTALFLLALYIAQVNGHLRQSESRQMVRALVDLPHVLQGTFEKLQKETDILAETFKKSRDFLYLGRGPHYPIALEGALKLKEISYIHAEGYPAGELKHGPIALIDREMPVLALAPRDDVYKKLISNVEEVKARHGCLILVGSENDENLAKLADHIIYLPTVHEELNPILYAVPLQLLAYQIANLRGCDVDQPRNLAKSVTVE